METFESIAINTFLGTLPKTPANMPMFRLVWSDEQFELRNSTFTEEYTINGMTFKGTTEGVRRVPKYNWIKERWIIEQWYPPEVAQNDDLPESIHGSYEPIYVFEDRFGRALPLNMTVVQIVIRNVMQPKRGSQKIKSDLQAELATREAAIDSYVDDYLAEDSHLIGLLHFNEAGIVPASYPIAPPNLRKKYD